MSCGASHNGMVSDLILLFVAATLIVIVVAMVRQRGNPGVAQQEPATPPDIWLAANGKRRARRGCRPSAPSAITTPWRAM